MNLRLQQLLAKVGELHKGSAPTRHDLSKEAGIDLNLVTKMFAVPQTRISQVDFDSLVEYFARQFREFVIPEITDQQLKDHLRFELIEFQHEPIKRAEKSCAFQPDGKYTLKDLLS